MDTIARIQHINPVAIIFVQVLAGISIFVFENIFHEKRERGIAEAAQTSHLMK